MLVFFATSAVSGGAEPPASQPAALAAVRAAEAERVAVLQKAAHTVVCVFADPSLTGGGSGVLISPRGYGLTNFHVVQEFLETRRGFGGLDDGRLYPLRVLGVDPAGDIALFKLEGRDEFPAATLADSDQLAVGERVAALGNPFLLAEDFTPSISFGIISGLRRYQPGQEGMLEYADCIQVSSSINPGNSGGPLFDMHGRVIGINGRGSFEERGRVNVGLGYAVSINQIKRFLPSLLAGGLCAHGTLGATVREIDDRLILDQIQSLSPAESAGLQLGDELLAVAGRTLHSVNDFTNIVTTLPGDWPVRVNYRRAGQQAEASLRTERLSLHLPFIYLPDPDENTRLVQQLVDALRQALGIAGAAQLPVSLDGDQSAVRGSLVIDSTGQPAFEWPSSASVPSGQLSPLVAPKPDTRDLARVLSILQPANPGTRTLIGGDELDGHIVLVIEQRDPGGAVVRWSFDLFTSDLREARGVTPEKTEFAWRMEAGVGSIVFNRVEADGTRAATKFSIETARHAAVPGLMPAPGPTTVAPPETIAIAGPYASAIERAQARVVKIFGRGIGRSADYASGTLVSADGRIVTGLASMLESPTLRVVLPDGRRLTGRVEARDDRRQLALLKIDARDLPFFELTGSESVQPGDWLISASNAFKVADGPEPVSVSAGILSGRTTLAARRRAQEFAFDGNVLLTDIIVSTPGAEGGALVDASGRLVGVLGKAVISKRTNTWVSYAIPVEEVSAFLNESRSNTSVAASRPRPPDSLLTAPRIAPDAGFRLFDVGGGVRPPYVERVRAGSPAGLGGLKPDDLILSVAGEHVSTCDEARVQLSKIKSGQRIELTVKRGNEVKSLELSFAEAIP